MSEVLTVALPDGVAVSEARWHIDSLLRDLAREAKLRATMAAVVASDEAFAAAFSGATVVRASVYDKVSPHQEIERFRFCYGSTPQRPVTMRGARVVLEARFGGVRPWLARVAERWMRMAKITAFSREEFDDAVIPLRRMLLARVDGRRAPELSWSKFGDVLVNGEWVHLAPGALNRLRALHSVRAKTEKLERRAAEHGVA